MSGAAGANKPATIHLTVRISAQPTPALIRPQAPCLCGLGLKKPQILKARLPPPQTRPPAWFPLLSSTRLSLHGPLGHESFVCPCGSGVHAWPLRPSLSRSLFLGPGRCCPRSGRQRGKQVSVEAEAALSEERVPTLESKECQEKQSAAPVLQSAPAGGNSAEEAILAEECFQHAFNIYIFSVSARRRGRPWLYAAPGAGGCGRLATQRNTTRAQRAIARTLAQARQRPLAWGAWLPFRNPSGGSWLVTSCGVWWLAPWLKALQHGSWTRASLFSLP